MTSDENIVEKGIIKFDKDFHPEFDGWIGIEGNTCWISCIQSKESNKGNFSRFLEELKQKYDCIKIPTPFALMKLIALKKGFVETTECFPEPFNEEGEVLIWRK